MSAKKKTEKVRSISVQVGDAFGYPDHAVVVHEVHKSLGKAEVISADYGRRSWVSIRRLQREYARLGEVATLNARRAVARRMAEKEARRPDRKWAR